MEDAMIINKCSEERGLAHGSIYKSEFIELDHPSSYFARDPEAVKMAELLDSDGLPYIGQRMVNEQPHYSYYNFDKSNYSVVTFKGKEECYLHSVKLCGNFAKSARKVACFTYRVPVS